MCEVSIYFFIGDLYPGGAERQLVHLCNDLCRRGWQVSIVTLKDGEAYQDDLDPRVTRKVLSTVNPFVVVWRLIKLLQRQRRSVLINFLFHATLLGRVAAQLAGVPCISSYRNISYGSAKRDALVRLTAWLDTATLSNVSGARGPLFPPRSRRELHVIPNMYLGNGAARNDRKLADSREKSAPFHWCFIGRLQPQKNLAALLHAFKELVACHALPMHLSIAGDGSQAEAVSAQIDELGLSSSVSLLGHVVEPERLLQSADALILPSRWEGMPNVLMEAMAAGLPCVATPVGAVTEMLQDGRGILTEGTDPGALAEAMQKSMSLTIEERQEMGRRAQAYIQQECSPEAVIERWEQVLLSVVKE